MRTGKDALEVLDERLQAGAGPGVDVILKEHDPPGSNAVRFLQKLRETAQLTFIPVIGAPPAARIPAPRGAAAACASWASAGARLPLG